MSNTKLIIFMLFIYNCAVGQKVCNDFYNKKFTKAELVVDLEFIKEKILNAHINPFTEISKDEFESKISRIKGALKDGMTQRDFYFIARPIFVKLNDEHSGLNDYCITDSIKANQKFLPLRFKADNSKVILSENYSYEQLSIGDELLSINEYSINEIIDGCAEGVFGISDERNIIAIERLWLYLTKFCFFIDDDYNLKFKSGKSVLIKGQTWNEMSANIEKANEEPENYSVLNYNRINNFGYLTINSFSDRQIKLEQWQHKLDSIFTKINRDKVNKLIIDVSNNGGGNSAVGNLLIDYISDKSYHDYGGSWKKSQEYVELMKKRGYGYAKYEQLKDGEILPLVSEINSPTENKNRFTGETFILVGENTFSSAMMFAVIVLDNELATVAGMIPRKGHPNHFGELIGFTTPNTNLYFRFGVKEWIRPSGIRDNNKLIPNIIIDLDNKSKKEIVQILN